MHVHRRCRELDEPFMEGQAIGGCGLRGYGELGHFTRHHRNGILQGPLHFLGDHMLAESTGEMLGTAGDLDAWRRERSELHGVADLVAPKAGVGVEHQGILRVQLHLGDGPRSAVVALHGHEAEVDAIVQHQQQAVVVVLILVGDEALARGKELHAGHARADERFHAAAIRRVVHPAIHE